MDEQLKSNLTSSKFWVRMMYMLFLIFFLYIAFFVIAFVVIVQCGITLITGGNNTRLKSFGSSLVQYIQQGLMFLTFGSEHKPFPFSDWPTADYEEPLNDFDDSSDEAEAEGADVSSGFKDAEEVSEAVHVETEQVKKLEEASEDSEDDTADLNEADDNDIKKNVDDSLK